MKKIISIIVFILAAKAVLGQKVTFYSPEFEEAVRQHIGLEKTEDVLQTQTDSITNINLSGRGIKDIRDVVYLPAVKTMNLSYNSISDISPLLPLEALEKVDLSNNELESINVLAFMQIESLQVDVSNNYILDFSYFFSPTPCKFSIFGMGLQQEKDAPYFDVYQLFANFDGTGRTTINYCGYTNMQAAANLQYGPYSVDAQMDGDSHTAFLTTIPTETTEIMLTNGEKSASTYAVPPSYRMVEAGETILLETGLPEEYSLTAVYALKGTVEVAGSTIKYTAPNGTASDIVYLCYYKGSTLKGFSRFYLNKGDVNGDGKVNVTDVVSIIGYILHEEPTVFNTEAADVNGDETIDEKDMNIVIDNIMKQMQSGD